MRVAVVGAGQAGLVAAKYTVEEGFHCDVFEKTDKIGGNWNYVEDVGLDENGLPIYSSMYEDLRTNLPKECMTYPGFPYPSQLKESYISQEEVLKYLNNFAEKYELSKHIKFNSFVKKIEPYERSKWNIEVIETATKQQSNYIYDAVIIGIGHYNDPIVATIPGAEKFKGGVIHSHVYRKAKPYENKKVLIIGGGPSGIDISHKVATVAKKVYLSYRKITLKIDFPPSIIHKPVIKELTENGAIFEDLTSAEVDEIIYCTGYNYTFPFLTERCGIEINNNFVYPLYKQSININRPTMCLIGIPFAACLNAMLDLQVRFFLSTLTGHFQLPSKEHMLNELENFIQYKKEQGIDIGKSLHLIAKDQETYFNDLADTAKIKPIPRVVSKLWSTYLDSNMNFNDRYDIIDDETFMVEKLE